MNTNQLQTTKLRKYKNNYGDMYGRITINKKLTEKFIGDGTKDVVDVVVKYDEKEDKLIIEKIKID